MMTLLQTNPYDNLSAEQTAGIMAMSGGMMIFILLAYLFYSFCLYKIFQKAGIENAWGAFIPFYQNILLAEVVRKPLWFGILMCVPYVNIIFMIWGLNRLSKVFGQGIGFTVGLVLLGIIFLPLLAFGNYQYQPNLVSDERTSSNT